jgi:hypothetical protein
MFSETKIFYAPAEPFHVENFDAVFFFVASAGGPSDFDFRISEVTLLAYL